jgi:SAM-dependent methyltransferase
MSFLKSDQAIRRHRQEKRHREIDKIVATIVAFANSPHESQTCKILEFGCGNGFQLPYLARLGKVFGTDIYTSNEILATSSPAFCESDILMLPFANSTFDIIFSNHVVEHLPDPQGAFEELTRVATPDCLFVFSVPTNLWLTLALPAKYLGKAEHLITSILGKFRGWPAGIKRQPHHDKDATPDTNRRLAMEEKVRRTNNKRPNDLLTALLPRGHGTYEKFGECFRAFRISKWTRFFKRRGFVIHAVVPLLLYGPSERPVVPTMSWPARFGLCSSVLFLMGRGRTSDKDLP